LKRLYSGLIVIVILLVLGVPFVSGKNYIINDSDTVVCSHGCTCMGEKNAQNQGRVPCYWNSSTQIRMKCGVNQLGENMYCYSDTIPATTTPTRTVTSIITTTITPTPSPNPVTEEVAPSVVVTTVPAAPSMPPGVTVALLSCGSECRCILPDAAGALGLPLCNGNPALCSYDASGKAMYCYALASQATTTTVPGSGAIAPALSSCQGDCSCLDPVTAGQVGLTLCNGTPKLCNYDSNRNPMYCYSRAAAVTQAVPGTDSKSGKSIPVGVFTIIGAVFTVVMIAGFHSLNKNQ